ncbi:MAG TPA: elongation factor P maturation arginine rhamnosyltransferase EarP [Ramlibacter sp.]|nr:elongation factor P maturation arginine rhamnosyltransferase EarP [Ramlibacter sp.]
MLWDIFCKVIDNHGDIGVCWRLAAQLADRGEQVRLWVDDASALQWMAPAGKPGVQVLAWLDQLTAQPGDAVVEAFGCELEPQFQAALAAATAARRRPPAWINLEYLTAESFAQRSHALPSPVLAGPAAGLVKRFFHPGFTTATGGLLREGDLAQRQSRFDRAGWLRGHGIEVAAGTRLVSLFCYEPPALPELLGLLAGGTHPSHLIVTAGRANAAVTAILEAQRRTRPAWPDGTALAITRLPLLSQLDFDHLLWACDLNFVRGEDSLVRALWAAKPLVWQLYPQSDDAHHAKLAAFLDWLEAPPSLRQFHQAWNGVADRPLQLESAAWQACAQAARQRLWIQPDLVSQLLHLVRQNGRGRSA